ncbi:hypothetical protein GOODEAATRI_005487 [Goodea atripinnis]|uniref:C2 domain-containing protein n=1 Tax=Goodea atripinnis TaxID=208336 RepID=A0ABV0MPJ4_9TELE
MMLQCLWSLPADNGLNPTWQRKSFHFTVCNSAFAFLRFGVYEIDMFNDQNFLAQATFPIQGLKTGVCSADLLPGEKRKIKCGMDVISCECFVCFCIVSGYRSVPLKNSYNEDLELASLLVYMDITRGRVGWSFLTELVLNLLIITGIKQQDENGEVMSPFSAVGTTSVPASTQVGRERFGELGSVSSTSSTMSPLSQSPAQAMSYRGREGSFESRYQSPIDDFRVSQETLLDQMDPQSRR